MGRTKDIGGGFGYIGEDPDCKDPNCTDCAALAWDDYQNRRDAAMIEEAENWEELDDEEEERHRDPTRDCFEDCTHCLRNQEQIHRDPKGECPESCVYCMSEAALEKERKKGMSPLEREWGYLSKCAQDLVSDLIQVKDTSDSNEMGMEPFARLRKALDSALDLLQSDPHGRLANAIIRELEYVRQGLDKQREWMVREAARRGGDEARFRERMERDKETRAYRNTMSYQPEQSALRGPAIIRRFQEDLRRASHPNYRIPRRTD